MAAIAGRHNAHPPDRPLVQAQTTASDGKSRALVDADTEALREVDRTNDRGVRSFDLDHGDARPEASRLQHGGCHRIAKGGDLT